MRINALIYGGVLPTFAVQLDADSFSSGKMVLDTRTVSPFSLGQIFCPRTIYPEEKVSG